MKKDRIDSLDSLRGIASMIVVIFHTVVSYPAFYNANYHFKFESPFLELLITSPLHTFVAGGEAVLLFFILSGFVLTLPFTNKSNDISYFEYIKKRFCRIYIPYILIMLFSIMLMFLLANYNGIDSLSPAFNNRWQHQITVGSIISYLFMIGYDQTNVNGVVWSLDHEMRISLIFPFLVLLLLKSAWLRNFLYLTIVCLTLKFGLLGLSLFIKNAFLSAFIYSLSNTSYYTILFLIGALFAKNRKEICAIFISLKTTLKWGIGLLGFIFLNFKWIFYGLSAYKSNFVFFNMISILNDFMAVLGVILLMLVVLCSIKVDKFLNKKPLLWLGKISYSLYLVHTPVLMVTIYYFKEVFPLYFSILIAPILALPVAHLSFIYIELPAIRLGKIKGAVNKTSKNIKFAKAKS
ncbi:acyltransferase [Metabacillus sp. FJAT-52054]|uniref:Acyltransferase n=1 Tax=Metabacillus sediminis TaxID=3117746 RepID=A0ABZ2NHJ7_9BACI